MMAMAGTGGGNILFALDMCVELVTDEVNVGNGDGWTLKFAGRDRWKWPGNEIRLAGTGLPVDGWKKEASPASKSVYLCLYSYKLSCPSRPFGFGFLPRRCRGVVCRSRLKG